MERLVPSAYHDPREVVWKHLVAQAYWDILAALRRDGVAIGDFDAMRLSFLRSFNGQHDIDLLCRKADAITSELVASLERLDRRQTAAAVAGEIAKVRESLPRAMDVLKGLRQVDRGPSYIVDGLVMIAGRPAEEFAANPDFIRATLELVGEDSPDVAAQSLAAWRRGFIVDAKRSPSSAARRRRSGQPSICSPRSCCASSGRAAMPACASSSSHRRARPRRIAARSCGPLKRGTSCLAG